MLFATRVSLKGNIGQLGVRIVGAAALWFVALILFIRSAPDDELFKKIEQDPITLTRLAALAADTEARLGWQSYRHWKDSLDGYSIIFSQTERNTLKNLLSNTFYRREDIGLKEAEVNTVFLYFNKYSVKLQRIRGIRNGGRTEINFSSSPSLPAKPTGSVLLVGEGSPFSISNSYPKREGETSAEILTTKVDCLIVADYDDDIPEDGDYLTVDVKKFSAEGRARIDLDLVSFERAIKKFNIWNMKPTIVPEEDEIPLSLRPIAIEPRLKVDFDKHQLATWLTAIDNALSNLSDPGLKPLPRQRLEKIKQTIREKLRERGEWRFLNLTNGLTSKSQYGFHVDTVENVVLGTFLWSN
jgi:hypothetical protein